jgi:glucosamine--fructose-6-phosphate aminotransferase (isomerizing)
MKEISYEHAEGFSAAELKHGPLALVTEDTPVFGVFTGEHTSGTLNNLEEVKARGAPVVVIAPESVADRAGFADHLITFPDTHERLAGVLGNVELQLVSYYTANLLERPIDKPRNLAKSVTVE